MSEALSESQRCGGPMYNPERAHSVGRAALQYEDTPASVRQSVDGVLRRYDESRRRRELAERYLHHPFNDVHVVDTMYRLAEQLNPRLGMYDLVVGEDTSGRLPALLYWRLINIRRREEGQPHAQIRFINGRYDGPLRPGRFPQETADTARALLVSEFVSSGGSLTRLFNHVRKDRDEKRVDLAALESSVSHPIQTSEVFQDRPDFFTVQNIGPVRIDDFLYGDHLDPIKGVRKNDMVTQPFSLPALSWWYSNRSLVPQARQDIHLIAAEFYDMLPPVETAAT